MLRPHQVADTRVRRRRVKTTCALAADSGVEVHRPALIPPSLTDGIQRYPFNWRAVTHGWRWYRVENGQLVSPLQGYPLRCLTTDIFRERTSFPKLFGCGRCCSCCGTRALMTSRLLSARCSALCCGTSKCHGLGLSATEYQAQVILTDGLTGLDDSYDLPIVETEIDLILLRDIEVTKDDASWPAAAVRSAALRATVNRVVREASGPSAH